MFRRLCLALAVGLWAVASWAQVDNESAILEIIVNGANEGRQFVQLTGDGDVLVTPKLLEELRLKPELWAGQVGERISLRALTPKIQFSLDLNSSMLNLAVPPHWFEKQVIQKEKPALPSVKVQAIRPKPMAAFLNYNAQANATEGQGVTSVDLPLELGFNRGQWLALSSSRTRYDTQTHDTESIRQLTTVTWDDTENLRRLSLGDFMQPYSLLQGGGNFGGISWRKHYYMDRSFKYSADLSLETVIDTPTHAQLFVNGRVVQEWDLLPGIVNFSEISSYAGGDAELLLTDAFGREQRIAVPSYVSQMVLRKGIHDYAYSAGWQRENFGQSSADYGDFTVIGYHRYGFADSWTGGISFAASPNSYAAGPSLAALLGGFSQIETGFLLSREQELDVSGYKATARYSYRYKKISGQLGVTGTSEEYAEVPAAPEVTTVDSLETVSKPRMQSSASVNYSNWQWGSLGIAYMQSSTWSDDDTKNRISWLTYRKKLDNSWFLTFRYRRDLENKEGDEGYVGVQYYPVAKAYYDNAALESRLPEASSAENRLGVQKSVPRSLGGGYSAALTEHGGDLSANARGQYKNQRGIYTAFVNQTTDSQYSGSMSVAGGIAVLDGVIYQGRPITDSFAVVQVEGLDGVTVESSNAPAGTAGNDKDLLISDLSSYNKNRVSISVPKLPLNYIAAEPEQTVEVQQRSGSMVKFKFERFSAVEGHIYLRNDKGEKVSLEAVPLEFVVSGKQQEAFLGKEGYFYLENLTPGKYQLHVRLAGRGCYAEINVPESGEIVTDLGEIMCYQGEQNLPHQGDTNTYTEPR
ncbi:MAG TPA: fimbria/pilus outer membrane usher protein [Gammaproteobacteria bacterium]